MTFRRTIFIAAAVWWSGSAGVARDSWLKVSTPEVTVITTLGKKEATACATEFGQYITALRTFFGQDRAELPPLTIVAFAQERDFQRYLPLATRDGNPQPVGGFFVRHEAWAVVGMPAQVSEDTRRTIFHEGVHWFLSASKTRNPLWLEEGLAEVFSTFHAEKGAAEWGRAIERHVKLLRIVALPPLEKLLHTIQSELYGNERLRSGVVYAQSWAFVHFLVFGKHDIPQNAISEYLEAISVGTHPDEAFRKIFGRSYVEMDQLFRAYLADGKYRVTHQPLAEGVKPTAQPATLAEVENALGRLAIAGKRTAQAMSHAGAALAAAPNEPQGHELLALAFAASGDKESALNEFEAAIGSGSKDFQPYFEVAAAAHQRAINEGRSLTPVEARMIANRYARAISYYSRFRASYENLAALMGVVNPVRQEDRTCLELGHRLFPESPTIELGLAQFAYRAGDAIGARTILDRVRSRPGLSAEVIAIAQRFDLNWTFEEIARRVDELARAGRFSEAIAFLDAKVTDGVAEPIRLRLVPVREQLHISLLSQQIKQALNEKHWVAARRALGRLLESSAPSAVKSQARSTLAQLDEHKLGLETEAVAPAPE